MSRLSFFEKSQIDGVEDLTLNECVEYNGGESFWYWITYGVGRGLNAVGRGLNAVGKAAKYVIDKNVELIVENGGLPHAY